LLTWYISDKLLYMTLINKWTQFDPFCKPSSGSSRVGWFASTTDFSSGKVCVCASSGLYWGMVRKSSSSLSLVLKTFHWLRALSMCF
jgi:hypothetical protein